MLYKYIHSVTYEIADYAFNLDRFLHNMANEGGGGGSLYNYTIFPRSGIEPWTDQ